MRRLLLTTALAAACASAYAQKSTADGIAEYRAMLADGLFQRFPCQSLFGMHNRPKMAVGRFSVHKGPMMAGGAFFDIKFDRGGAGLIARVTNYYNLEDWLAQVR